jgi:16S rRNA (guanine527-N7)-methyltransferase
MHVRDFEDVLADRLSAAGLSDFATFTPKFKQYFDLLVKWNRRLNLTALRLEPPDRSAIDRLFVEPLFAARFLTDRLGSTTLWMDVGSGSGSPAIPLRIARPTDEFVMIESRARKASFLSEVVRQLRFSRVTVRAERHEDVSLAPQYQGRADLLTVRAVRADEVLFSSASRLLKQRGYLLLFVSRGSNTVTQDFHAIASAQIPLDNESELLLLQRAMSVPRGTI